MGKAQQNKANQYIPICSYSKSLLFFFQPPYDPQEGQSPVELVFTVDDTIRGYIEEAVTWHAQVVSHTLAWRSF